MLEDRRVLSRLSYATGYLPLPGNTISAEAVVVDSSGSSYITGGFTGAVTLGTVTLTSRGNSDAYVAKINPSGTVAWARRVGSPQGLDGDFGRGIALDAAGNVYVTGFLAGTSDFLPIQNVTVAGGRDVFVAKFDHNGATVWARSYGGAGNDLGQSIAVDASGNIFLTGSFEGTAKFGTISITSSGGPDVFVAKLAPNGNPLWAKGEGGGDVDSGFSLALDGAGNVYTTGIFGSTANFGGTSLTSAGDSDLFVQKMNTNGQVVYAKRFGSAGHDDGVSLASDAAGNVVVTGDFTQTINFGGTTLTQTGTIPGGGGTTPANATFLTRLDPSGNVLWAKSFGADSKSSAGFGVAYSGGGTIYTTGVYQGTVAFGSTNLTSKGDYDVYVVTLGLDGAVQEAQSFGSTSGDQSFAVAAGGSTRNFTVVGNYVAGLSVSGVALPTPPASSAAAFVVQYNPSATLPPYKAPSDFEGVGKTQAAVFQPFTADWYVQGGASGSKLMAKFGAPYYFDIPVAGDYLKTGRSQIAVFRVATAEWFVRQASGATVKLGTFGGVNFLDLPVPGDYLGTGGVQQAVFRPSTAQWFVKGSGPGNLFATFGGTNYLDIPVPGDYDGTGTAQVAIFRPSTGQWFIKRPGAAKGQLLATFGATGLSDIPVPGDYDGTGRTQVAVYRPSTSQFIVYRPTGPAVFTVYGAPNLYDVPTQAPAAALKALNRVYGAVGRSVSLGASSAAAPAASSASGSTASAPAQAQTPAGSTSATSKAAVAIPLRASVVAGQAAVQPSVLPVGARTSLLSFYRKPALG